MLEVFFHLLYNMEQVLKWILGFPLFLARTLEKLCLYQGLVHTEM